jgi:Fe-S-cluster containining protein
MSIDRYECDGCGACCRHMIIEIEDVDVVREPRLKEVAKPFATEPGMIHVDHNGDEYVPIEPGWEAGAMLACGSSMPCGMLAADNRCSIYPTRPNCCVAFRAGSEQCQDCRTMAKLPPLAPVATAVDR